jgi:serine/threonine-protein kinase
LQVPDALRIFRAVAEGIAYAHRSGIIHRDIKPDNILLGEDGSVKIVDFGLACMIEGDPSLSRTGTILGSPNFMSPEQALGKRVDQRSDIYSLGATLYQILTGVPPFQASSSIGVVCKVVREALRPPHESNPELPAALSRYICFLMRKDRDKRVSSMEEALVVLDRLEKDGLGRPAWRPAKRHLLAAAMVILTALVLALGYVTAPWSQPAPVRASGNAPGQGDPATDERPPTVLQEQPGKE